MRKKRKIRTVNFDENTQSFINSRTSRGFPLGGIGNGGFSVFTDGGFGEFRTQHNWFHAIKNPKGTFFGVWAENDGNNAAKILRGGYRGGGGI